MIGGGRLGAAAGAALVLFALAFRLGGYPLLDPDEGRNAEVAREMAVSNDYLIPRLNGLPYVDKPVVYFATVALSMELLGTSETAARLPSLLFTLATAAAVFRLARRMYDPRVAFTAAVATAATPLALAFSRTVIFDAAMAFFVVVAIGAFYLAAEYHLGGPAGRRAGAWLPATGWAAIALGVLTKGPVALAVPLMVAVPYMLWRGAWKPLLDPVGILLFVAIVLPWVRAMALRVPDYLHYVVVTETFQRLTTPALQRTGPWWYFLPIFFLGTLPWSVMAWGRSRPAGGESRDPRAVLLLLWVVVPLIFFSLSQSKRPQYVLPLVPAVAMLAAARWSTSGVVRGAIALAVFGGAILALFPRLPVVIRGVSPTVASAIPATAIALAAACLVASACAALFRRRSALALAALSLPVLSIPFISQQLMRQIGRERSAADLAAAIDQVVLDATEVVGVRAWPPSLSFYLGRTITIATDSATELTSNYVTRHVADFSDAPGTPLRPGDWWREAAINCERPRIFVIRNADREAWEFLSSRLPPVAATAKYSAFGPCGLPALALGPPGMQRKPS